MIIYTLLSILWITFIVYWIISSFSAKKTIARSWSSYGVRLLVLLALILLWSSNSHGWQGYAIISSSLTVKIIGLILVSLGISVAIWARVYLGRNWGMPMSLKEEPELVTTGPYVYIRHPIYSGVLVAMIGSVLITGIGWLVSLVIFSAYFVYSATKEEKIMTRQFPNQYPEYKKKTKMLVPFIL